MYKIKCTASSFFRHLQLQCHMVLLYTFLTIDVFGIAPFRSLLLSSRNVHKWCNKGNRIYATAISDTSGTLEAFYCYLGRADTFESMIQDSSYKICIYVMI